MTDHSLPSLRQAIDKDGQTPDLSAVYIAPRVGLARLVGARCFLSFTVQLVPLHASYSGKHTVTKQRPRCISLA